MDDGRYGLKMIRGNRRELLFWLVLLGLKLLAFTGVPASMEVDSEGYMGIDGFSFVPDENWLNELRVPVYPFLCECFERLFGEWAPQAIAVFQLVVSCVAVYYLFKMLHLLKINIWVARAVTVVYALSISVMSWENLVLTESLALSTTVFYIYLLVSYIKKPAVRPMLAAGALMLFMVFMRPTFLVLPVITLVFMAAHALITRVKLRTLLPAAVGPLAVVAACLVYMGAFQQVHGSFTMSNTLLNQQLAVIIRSDLYTLGGDIDIDIVNYLGRKVQVSIDDGTYYLPNDLPELTIGSHARDFFTSERMSWFEGELIKAHPFEYLRYKFLVLMREVSVPFGRAPNVVVSLARLPGLAVCGLSYFLLSVVHFGYGIQVAFVAFVAFFYKWIRKKQLDYVLAGVWVFITVFYVSSIFGTCGDYTRTAVAALPFILLGTAMGASAALAWLKKRWQKKINQ